MSHKAALSVSVPVATYSSKLSKAVQRHNSEELTAIDISPPRRRSRLFRSINPVFVESSVLYPCSSCDLRFLAGYSWMLRPGALLVWRGVMFLYVAITLAVIAVSDIARVYTLSLCIYCAQLVCCCLCVLSSCVSVFGRRKGFHKRSPTQRTQFGCVIDTVCIISVQNVITLCLYNDIVVSIRDEMVVVNAACFKLVHWYNLIPAAFELVLSCAEYEARYYAVFFVVMVSVLSTAFMAKFISWMPSVTQVYEDLWHSNNNASAVMTALQMATIATLCGVTVMGAQKLRQRAIRQL